MNAIALKDAVPVLGAAVIRFPEVLSTGGNKCLLPIRLNSDPREACAVPSERYSLNLF